jgi:transposase
MDGKVLGVERRRRWNKEEKARIVEETLMPDAVVCEIARRHGVAQSLLFTWRRQARVAELSGRDGSILLPVEIGAMTTPSRTGSPRQLLATTNRRRPKSGVIEIELGSGSRVRVDNEVDADALRRVLGVLSEQ